MGIEPGLGAGAQRLHVSDELRNECIRAAQITGRTHHLEPSSGVDGVRDTERYDRASELVRGGAQRRPIAGVNRRSHRVNLHRNRLHEKFREFSNQHFVTVLVEQDSRIEGHHHLIVRNDF